MTFRSDEALSHDDAEAAVLARLERLFARRAQKAESYCRILLTAAPRPATAEHRPG